MSIVVVNLLEKIGFTQEEAFSMICWKPSVRKGVTKHLSQIRERQLEHLRSLGKNEEEILDILYDRWARYSDDLEIPETVEAAKTWVNFGDSELYTGESLIWERIPTEPPEMEPFDMGRVEVPVIEDFPEVVTDEYLAEKGLLYREIVECHMVHWPHDSLKRFIQIRTEQYAARRKSGSTDRQIARELLDEHNRRMEY